MTATLRPQDGRHRRARLSLRARDRIEVAITIIVLAVISAAIVAVLVAAVTGGGGCAPIVVESTGTWQHDHAAVEGPDPDWGTYDCVEVTGLSTREDLSVPWIGEATPSHAGNGGWPSWRHR